MILRQLVLHNFGPFRGRVEIDLSPTPGVERPIILFGAMNGGGKTSILDAILLTLYGKRARCSKRGTAPYPEFLKSCIHERASGADGAVLELTFEYAGLEGHALWHVIRRWYKTPSGAISEAVAVNRDGVLDMAATETWDQRVEELLPLGLSNLFFFDGEQVRMMALEGAATPEMQSAIQTLLGLALPARLTEDLGVLMRRQLKEGASSEVANEVPKLEAKLNALHERRAQLRVDLGEARNHVGAAERGLEDARAHFTSQGGEQAERLESTERAKRDATDQAFNARESLRRLAEGALPFGMLLPQLERLHASVFAEVESAEALVAVAVMKNRDERTLSLLRELKVPSDAVQRVSQHLTADLKTRAPKKLKGPPLGVTREAAEQVQSVLRSQLPEAWQATKRSLADLQAAEADLERFEGMIESAAPRELFGSMVDRVADRSAQLTRAQEEQDRVEAALAAIEPEIRDAEQLLQRWVERAVKEREATQSAQRVTNAAQRALDVLVRYEARLKSRKLTTLERRVTERFRHLARKEDLVERIEIDDQTYALRLYDGDGRSLDHRQLSAGEQQLLAVAFLWGLADASGRSLPVVIDTPLARMDSHHRTHLVERYFPSASHQVILLSTDVEIDQHYTARLKALGALDRAYLISYVPQERRSTVSPGYFW